MNIQGTSGWQNDRSIWPARTPGYRLRPAYIRLDDDFDFQEVLSDFSLPVCCQRHWLQLSLLSR